MQRDPAHLAASRFGKTAGSNETARWATNSRVSDGFFASRLNYPGHKSAEQGDRSRGLKASKQESSLVADLRSQVAGLQKKAESRKESLKLLYKVLTEKEKAADRLEQALGESSGLIELVAKQGVFSFAQFEDMVSKRLDDNAERVEGLQQLLSRLQGTVRGALIEQSRQPQYSFGPEGSKERLSAEPHFSAIPEVESRRQSHEPRVRNQGQAVNQEPALRTQLDQVSQLLKTATEEKTNLDKSLKEREREKAALSRDLESSQAQNRKLTDFSKQQESQMTRLREEAHDLTHKLSSLSASLKAATEETTTLRSQLDAKMMTGDVDESDPGLRRSLEERAARLPR
jgi:chromosome segregation ATPase